MVAVTRGMADRGPGRSAAEGGRGPGRRAALADQPGSSAGPRGHGAAVTIAMPKGALTFAASDHRLDELHRIQFDGGDGPVEPRRVDDTAAELRWSAFCRAAAQVGFGSCLALPLRTGRQPADAVALYRHEPDVFRGAVHDTALLFAAQGGTGARKSPG